MNSAGHQLLLNCLETLQRALKGESTMLIIVRHGPRLSERRRRVSGFRLVRIFISSISDSSAAALNLWFMLKLLRAGRVPLIHRTL